MFWNALSEQNLQNQENLATFFPVSESVSKLIAAGSSKVNEIYPKAWNYCISSMNLMKNAKIANLIKAAIVCATVSFLCFAFGGRTDVAIGGLLGELIAYGTIEWRNSLFDYGMHFLSLLK